MPEIKVLQQSEGVAVTEPSGISVGSGEKNYVTSPSAVGSFWVASGAGVTVGDTSTASECPRANTTGSAIKLTGVSGTDYMRGRWTLDDVDVGRPMHCKFDQRVIGALATGDFKVEMYYTTDSTYATGLTEQALATDASGTSSIPALDTAYITSWTPTSTALYWEVRLVRVAGTAALGVSDVVIGPGTVALSSGASSPLAWTPTGSWSTNTTYAGEYWRVGNTLSGRVRIDLAGAPTSANLTMNLPSGLTLDGTRIGAGSGYSYFVGDALIVDVSTSDRYFGKVRIASNANTIEFMYLVQSANTVTTIDRVLTSVSQAAPMTFASGDYITVDFHNVPITEWAGGAIAVIQDQNLNEWQSWTPTGSWVSNTTYTGRWRRVGDDMHGQVKVATSGAPTATTLTVNLPSGYTIDTTKVVDTSSGVSPNGVGTVVDTGTAFIPAFSAYNNTTSIQARSMIYAAGQPNELAAVNATSPMTWANLDYIVLNFRVPILEWAQRSGGGALGYGLATPDQAGIVRPEHGANGTTQSAYDATKTVRSGTYTPTATGTANTTAIVVTANSMQWQQVGKVVSCAGHIAYQAAAGASTLTTFTLSLPVLPTSNFALEIEGSGVLTFQPTTGTEYEAGFIRCTPTAKTVTGNFSCTNNAAGRVVTYAFQYVLN